MPDHVPNELKILAEKIAEFREKHHLTYQEMGEATEVDKSHVYRIENMAVYPSLKFLIRLAEYMDIPLFYLFFPSHRMSRQEYAGQIQSGLSRMKLTLPQLASLSEIPILRLMELEKGISLPAPDEWTVLQQCLQLKPDAVLAKKLQLLRSLLQDLGLQEEQTDNLMRYVQNQMK